MARALPAHARGSQPVTFDLEAIACAVYRFRAEAPRATAAEPGSWTALPDDGCTALLQGYRYLSSYTPYEHWLMPGYSKQILELNNIVLFGSDRNVRSSHRRALKHAERRFYEARESGIGNLVEWYSLNRNRSIWQVAAGLYIQILGNPQLFVEGNHRTAVLVMSRVLFEANQPPFVLTPELADDWLELTARIPALQRHGLRSRVKALPVRNALAALLESSLDSRFLKQPYRN